MTTSDLDPDALRNEPDAHLRWIYDTRFQNDPRARDLRERRGVALRAAYRAAPYLFALTAREPGVTGKGEG